MMKKPEMRIDECGNKSWYLNDELHREDGPAYEYDLEKSGFKRNTRLWAWYLNGEPHREDGPAVEWSDGSKIWYLNGIRHREDGPAVESVSSYEKWCYKKWFLNGKLHREDGPAIEFADGRKEWYLHGEELTEDEFNRRMKK